jgi:hypothetical protein
MKFCPVVPEICCGQVHGPRKSSWSAERKEKKEKEKKNNNNKI